MPGLEPIGEIAKRVYPGLKFSKPASERLEPTTPPSLKPVSENLLDDVKCQQCKDAHWLHPMKDGKPDYIASLVRCPCMRERDAAERMAVYRKFCRLPANLRLCTFESFDAYSPALQEALSAALEIAADNGSLKWLTLVSDRDRGKSHLAAAICWHWLERGKLARFGVVPDLLNELKSTFDKTEELTFKAMFDMICNVPLLVLDDLGVEKSTEWSRETLENLVNRRYNEGLPLVVTTNKSFDELEPRIASRLQRFQPGKVVVLDCGEYRLRKPPLVRIK